MNTAARIPHVLTLSQGNEEDWDGLGVNEWDDIELTCPHEASELMPCAVWVSCGCDPVDYEQDENLPWDGDDSEIDPLIGNPGSGPCPRSATGEHHYWEGEPHRPDAECWPTKHADFDNRQWAAQDLALPPGQYEVFPTPDGDGGLTLKLDPQGGTR